MKRGAAYLSQSISTAEELRRMRVEECDKKCNKKRVARKLAGKHCPKYEQTSLMVVFSSKHVQTLKSH